MKFISSNREYSKLIFANAISRFGDSIDMIAFSWLVYEITKSAFWAATIIGINQFVSVVFQPFMGAYVENKHKKKIMVLSDLLRFIVILILFGLNCVEMINEWTLIVFTICISIIETFRIPSGVSIIPMLLKEEDFDEGISLNNGISKICELFGLITTAFIINQINVMGAIMVDGVTFFISALLISFIRYNDTSRQKSLSDSYYKMALNGLKFLFQHKQLLLICIICSIINASVIPFDSLQSVFVNLYFEAKVIVISFISVSMMLGMILGSLTYKNIMDLNIFKNRKSILGIGGVAIGIFYIGLYFTVMLNMLMELKILFVTILAFVVGIFIAYLNAYVQIYFVQNVSKDYLSRISAIATTITSIGAPITSFFVAFTSKYLQCKEIFLFTGILSVIIFIALTNQLKAEVS